MNWNELEYSTANGLPVSLYAFMRNDAKGFYYTNADQAIELDGKTWLPLAISDSGVRTGETSNLDITLPSSSEVALLFRGVPPSNPVKVLIHRWHVDDRAGEFRTIWLGTINEVKRQSIDQAKLLTTSVAGTFTRSGLRLTYGRACPYALYDHHCRVNPLTVMVPSVPIVALDGAAITVTFPGTFTGGYFSGGYIEWDDDGYTERRGLRVHSGNQLALFGGTDRLAVGMKVNVFPGCDRTIKTCDEKFNNSLNYGGQPHMPGKSPYEIMKLF
ncbi:phage tail protein [Providencia stuartii]|uniref:Phage tail protein n=1 Tax=Providencia stuartii TaxID=588 RepID=A0A1S1HVA2_PROST|nr:phage tail protein [Providencia stuartii]